MKSLKSALLATATLSAIAFTGCANDAKVQTRDNGPANKINMPDKFPTLAIKCVAPGVLAVATGGSDASKGGLSVIAYDRCKTTGLPQAGE